MKKILKLMKAHDFHSIYLYLKSQNYNYTIDNFERDFSKIKSMEKFCYLIYLLSMEPSADNSILLCDFLLYTDTFFYDIHPIIRMIIQHAIDLFPLDSRLLNWVISTYKGHPDSPFSEEEIAAFIKTRGQINY